MDKVSLLKYRRLFILPLLLIVFASCGSDDPDKIAERDDKKIREWLNDKGYIENVDFVEVVRFNEDTDSFEDTGVYFVGIKAGEGDFPTEKATVNIDYTGTLLNGKEFDSRFGATLYLPNTIMGFRYGLTKFNIGSEGLLLIPSGLGYGQMGTTTVPRNSVLIFDIKMNVFSNGK
jgi:FKBP-type peptidyl-prolyl cis-trans isomerase FkpA